jgi:hypothetical protein
MGAPAQANHLARLSGGVDVSCDGPSAEYRAEVRNAGTQSVLLTHALLLIYTHEAGKPFWNQPTVTSLLEGAEDAVLTPGEQLGNVAMLSLVPGVDRVAAVLWVHVQGEPFWRVAFDSDRCQ